jgi:ferredoxin--NADP+ reductase
MSELGSASRPLRVAIVGSGPSGFYAAEALFQSGKTVHLDMFDRLPTPYGLVRGGVAPDHQKIKSVIKVYEKTARHDGYRFLGNVMIGRDLSAQDLRRFYDATIFTCGAETDRRLGIPGEDLPGSHTATAFVGWYNGHPDYRDLTFDLSGEIAVVIGQGNVAMDVSRILAKTVDELRDTDIAAHALEALTESRIREIHLIGRRGLVQAKFTPPEIKEIGELQDCDPVVSPEDLELNPASQVELDDPDNGAARRNIAVLREFAARPAGTKRKRYVIRSYESPIELKGEGKVERVVLEKNVMVGEPFKQSARGTGKTTELECGIFFRSVGYRGVAIPGVPFDEKNGVFPNRDGRILEGGGVMPGLYAAGWIKRGPSGVIGTNKPDSHETVQALLSDLPKLVPCTEPEPAAVQTYLSSKGVRTVNFQDWMRIDAAEVERGKAKGKPREKFTRIEEMLEVRDDKRTLVGR